MTGPLWKFPLSLFVCWSFLIGPCLVGAMGQEISSASNGRLIIIGATARTANELIPKALAAGYAITGLARQPENVQFEHERLTIVKGDIYDISSLEAVMTGTETVISLVGGRFDIQESRGAFELSIDTEVTGPFDLYSRTAKNTIQAMNKKGNRRLIFTTSGGVNVEAPLEKPAAPTETTDPDEWRRQMYFWNLRTYYDDIRRSEWVIQNSNVDFTILRPAQLMPVPARGDHKVTTGLSYPQFTQISYADFADFILEQVESGTFIGEAVAITSDMEF